MTPHHLLRRLLYVPVLLLGAPLTPAQITPPGDVPVILRPPAGARLVLAVHASGVQIYRCAPAADGKLAWTLKAPDAELRDAGGASVGHHSAGPTWRYKDGSEVSGKAAAHADSPDREAVPWLLLNVVAHSGKGLLSQVTSVQRLHTEGGAAPAAATCDASKQGEEARIPYSADYYFYAAPSAHGR